MKKQTVITEFRANTKQLMSELKKLQAVLLRLKKLGITIKFTANVTSLEMVAKNITKLGSVKKPAFKR